MKRTANTAFQPLFSMEVVHQYFNGGPCGAFAVTALGATRKVLQRFGWAGAQTENKYTLYADRARAAATVKQGAGVPLNLPDLCFVLEFRDSDFARYTDLPMQAGCVLSLVGGQARAQVSARPMLSAEDLVPVQSRTFQCPVAAGAGRADLRLVNLSGDEVLELPLPERGLVTIDPSVLDIGLYHVINKNNVICRFIKIGESFNLMFGFVLSISVKQMLSIIQIDFANKDFPQREPMAEAACEQLALPARSTLWRYDVFNHGGAAEDDFALRPAAARGASSHAAVLPAFKRVEGVVGPSGETSVGFQSVSPIPLSASPGERLTLLRHGQPLIEELRTPGLDFCQAQEGEGPCSNLFIHL